MLVIVAIMKFLEGPTTRVAHAHQSASSAATAAVDMSMLYSRWRFEATLLDNSTSKKVCAATKAGRSG